MSRVRGDQGALLLVHARLVTPGAEPVRLGIEPRLSVLEDGAIAVRGGRIVALGPTERVRRMVDPAGRLPQLDAEGRVALPGFVDPHTHLVWAGMRIDEMEERRRGKSYLSILKEGRGILATVRAVRQSSDEELLRSLLARLALAVRHGTTTLEVKSGYGLTVREEIRCLEVVSQAAMVSRLPLVPTLLGAHAWPPDVPRLAYRAMLAEMASQAAARGLARYVDVFLEEGVFTAEEAERILLDGKAKGLLPKVHADELQPSAGAETAARVGAVSADHLTKASDRGLAALAEAGVVAVLLPGTSFFLGEAPFPAERARRFRLLAALGTDANPGSSPTFSMPMVMALAVHQGGFTPAEALTMATINAARAVGEEKETGSLTVGKRADVVLLDADDWRAPVYHFGTQLVHSVLAGGRLLVQGGCPTREMMTWSSF